jgi:alkylation response protein AidB-like acyl-CoA dehydrogenase
MPPGPGPQRPAQDPDRDLLESEVEQDLRATVRQALADHCGPADLIAMYGGDRSIVSRLWGLLGVELGLAALLVPESHGGSGAAASEAAVVLEELGRAVAPVPFLTSAVVATTALAATDSDALEDLASGAVTAALAVPFATAPDGALATVKAADGRLTGTIRGVAGALEAQVLLVLAEQAPGLAMYLVPVAQASITPVLSLDMTRQLADVTIDTGRPDAVLADAEPAVRAALDVGAGLLASEQVGVAQWCLSTTVEYLKQRKQFGRVVGGFQALKHRLADVAVDVELASAAARDAAVAYAEGDDDRLLAGAVAQAHCSDVAVSAAEEALQLHGGVAMTWDYPVHLYLKRAKADQLAFGTPGAHRTRLAGLVDLPGPG